MGVAMPSFSLRNTAYALVISFVFLLTNQAVAGGITLGGTRVIYPSGTKQINMSVRNTSEQSNFLVQSWVEQEDGTKSQDFFVTPPLYTSGPGNENTLRLIYVGQPKQADQETLYYFNTKAIPSMDKKKMEGQNILMLAAVTRIKLFLRPDGLKPSVSQAPSELTFLLDGGRIRIDNPTPYYITLVQMNVGSQKLEDTMVSPRGSVSLSLATTNAKNVSFRTINDYGSVTPVLYANLK
jgi:fimbrial chaperone protein